MIEWGCSIAKDSDEFIDRSGTATTGQARMAGMRQPSIQERLSAATPYFLLMPDLLQT
jgi:hypothetical protein